MLVTLVVIGGFLALRGLIRDQAEVEVAPVDYQDAVAAAADAGLSLVHPRELPPGWKATSVDLCRDESPAWAMGMLTDEGRFVGIRQEEESADDLAAVALDEDAVEGEEVSLDSAIADTWTTWTDEGGDTRLRRRGGRRDGPGLRLGAGRGPHRRSSRCCSADPSRSVGPVRSDRSRPGGRPSRSRRPR